MMSGKGPGPEDTLALVTGEPDPKIHNPGVLNVSSDCVEACLTLVHVSTLRQLLCLCS